MQAIENIKGQFDYKIDIAVLLIFFNRPKTFSQVFEQVKTAKPSKLFLYCDGPRNEAETELVRETQKVAENIDWNCEVYKFYQEENQGCDPSEYIAQKWAFSNVDKCIVLEDDDVPSQSFFTFCKELLDKYESDERIEMISGMNHFGEYDNEFDYLFSSNCSIWGWASWSRVVNKWTDTYDILNNKKSKELFLQAIEKKGFGKKYIQVIDRHIKSKRAHYESIIRYDSIINNRLSIVPCKNLITNIGNNPEGGTHSIGNINVLPKATRQVLNLKKYELYKSIEHPDYMIEDYDYTKKVFNIIYPSKIIKYCRSLEALCLKIKYGRWDLIKKNIINKFK